MENRPIGSTGVMVSALGFGAATLGGIYGEVAETEAHQIVHQALDAGVTFFDVSPYDGQTLAEQVLGRVLHDRRDQATLCTKVGRYGDDDVDFSARAMRRSIEASLRRLHTDHIEIILAHDIEFGHPEIVLHETYETLRAFKREGLCRAIGMSGYPLAVLRQAVRQCDLDVVLSYGHGTLYNDDVLHGLLPLAQQRGTAVINAGPLAMGLLSDGGAPPWHPAPQGLKEAALEAVEACEQLGSTLPGTALRWSVRLPGLTATLCGIRSAPELAEALAALDTPPYPPALEAARRILAPWQGATWPSGNEAAWAAYS